MQIQAFVHGTAKGEAGIASVALVFPGGTSFQAGFGKASRSVAASAASLRCGGLGQAELAHGTFRHEIAGDAERAAGPGRNGWRWQEAAKGKEARGFGEADAGSELPGGRAEDAPTEARVERAEAVDLEREAFWAGAGRDTSAAAADGFAGEQQLWEEAVELELPAGLIFAGELGQIGKGLVKRWVELAQLRQQLMAEAVAGKGRVGV